MVVQIERRLRLFGYPFMHASYEALDFFPKGFVRNNHVGRQLQLLAMRTLRLVAVGELRAHA
jgi:hypothetical protein